MYQKLLGIVRLVAHAFVPGNWYKLKNVVEKLLDRPNVPKGKVFVMFVGFSKSGKTTYLSNSKELKGFFKVSSSAIHDLINVTFSFLKDDNTTKGRAYWERQYLTRIIRELVLKKAFAKGLSVVSDSANLRRSERGKRLALAKKFGYTTKIVHVSCSEQVLLKRLQMLDAELVGAGKKPTWVALYKDVQKPRFEGIISSEADYCETINIDS